MNFYKNFTHALPVLFLSFFLILTGCDKNDDTDNSLPSATQTGENIFACYVNGEIFKGIPTNTYYQLVEGKYYFAIGCENKNGQPQFMYIQSENLSITEGSTYILKKIEDGNAYSGIAYIISPTEYYNSFTDDEFTGELTITKFDMENYIVSGTFWFDVQHPVTGERVEIREGRFDAQFGL